MGTRGPIFGWDIGGAHVKVARLVGARIDFVAIIPCQLWRGPELLVEVLAGLCAELKDLRAPEALHAVTMTGELVDAFADRAAGVAEIAGTFAATVRPPRWRLYAARGAWFDGLPAGREARLAIASANYSATVRFAAAGLDAGLLVDLGSTTTDVQGFAGARAVEEAVDDFGRLATGELVYLGVVRTPVFHLAPEVSVRDRRRPLIPEYFADLGDAMVIAGRLRPEAIAQPGLDGAGRDVEAARRRLARALGTDADLIGASALDAVAGEVLGHLEQRLLKAIARRRDVLGLAASAPVVGAGIGRGVIAGIAARGGWAYRDLADLFAPHCPGPELAERAADAAPAASLALLAGEPVSSGA